MSNFIRVYENAASEDYCQRMMERLDTIISAGSGHHGEVDNGGVAIRKDMACYFQRDAQELAEETYAILARVLAQYLDEHPSLGMHRFRSLAVKVQRTPPKGGFHAWHCEKDADNTVANRCLVWMIYLNTTPEGEGTTEFLEQGVRLQPTQGSVVFFPAAWTHTHRGNPVYSDNKYIATGWYYLE